MPRKAARSAGAVLRSGYIGEGPITARFESRLAQWLDEAHVAVTDSCTSALTLALHLARVGPGSEVISSPLTCVAANTAVLRRGGVIRWADVNPRTGNMSPESLDRRITKNTVAILYTDWAGTPANEAGKIQSVAERQGIPTIEDAASAIGARVGGKPLTKFADYVCYSFQAVKHLTTINGGALVVRDAQAAQRARLLRWYGLPRTTGRISMAEGIDLPEAGYKMHLNDVSSAIGIAQLEYIDRVLAAHRKNAAELTRVLEGTKHFRAQQVGKTVLSSYSFLTVLADTPENRRVLIDACHRARIATSVVHRRNDHYSVFSRSLTSLPGVDAFSNSAIALPCGWWLKKADLARIADTIQHAEHASS